MSFLNFAKSKGGKSSLSEGTVVKDLVIDLGECSTDVRLHHDVLGFTESVMESVMVDLVKGSTLALLGSGSIGLDEGN